MAHVNTTVILVPQRDHGDLVPLFTYLGDSRDFYGIPVSYLTGMTVYFYGIPVSYLTGMTVCFYEILVSYLTGMTQT
jgi:hypothetical protein